MLLLLAGCSTTTTTELLVPSPQSLQEFFTPEEINLDQPEQWWKIIINVSKMERGSESLEALVVWFA